MVGPGPAETPRRPDLLRTAYVQSNKELKELAPDIYLSAWKERARHQGSVGLTPSESIMAPEVLRGVTLMLPYNKYAEGRPGARYYQGLANIDDMERLAVQGMRDVFSTPEAKLVDGDIEPLSGAIANFATELAIAGIGGKCVGLRLDAGAHLSHGSDASATSKLFDFRTIPATVDGNIDYDQAEAIIRVHDPALIIIGATSLPRNPDWKLLREISGDRMIAADIAHTGHLIATGVLDSPVPYVDVITGTTHKGMRGPKGAYIGITESGRDKRRDLARTLRTTVFPRIQGGFNALNAPGIGITMRRLKTPGAKREAAQTLESANVMADEFLVGGVNLLTGGTNIHYLTAKFDVIDGEPTTITGNLIAEASEVAGFTPNRNGVVGIGDVVLAGGLRAGPVIFTERGGSAEEARLVAKALVDIIREANEVCLERGISFEDQRDPEVRSGIIRSLSSVEAAKKISRDFCRSHPLPLPM